MNIKDVVSHKKEFITIDDNLKYKRCRVQLRGQGIVLRDEVFGENIKTKRQQICQAKDFLVAEIDAKFGGYGIVPNELDGAVVSSHYFLFKIDKTRLLPEYLSIFLKLDVFASQIKATGSTNYAAIRPQHVLNYKIALPIIEVQQKLVDNYYGDIKKAERLESEVIAKTKQIEEVLFNELGISIEQKQAPKKQLIFIKFENLREWGIDKIFGNNFSN
ncbi:MAG: restriction endonuclease subunit S, partial [Saprospiraceae bacterium]|nr:restriction endonuclease subunit S [Saprospiraceae bacterium]